MASVKIPTSFNIDLEFETANIGLRHLAWWIDLAIKWGFTLVMAYIVGQLHYSQTVTYVLYFFVYILPNTFYFLVSEIIMNGQTPGKRMLSMRVRNLHGGKPSISQYLIRWLFRFVESILLFIPVIAMVRSPYDQRVGDIVAGTIVVSTKTKSSLHDTIFRDMSATDYTPQFPQILKLSDRDMNKIKELMDRAIKSHNMELTARVSYRIRDVLKIETEMEHLTFLETVLNDYNYYTTR
jgi:uncharacterized RDD family membrane protein YckC